jgi:hypothetical protein
MPFVQYLKSCNTSFYVASTKEVYYTFTDSFLGGGGTTSGTLEGASGLYGASRAFQDTAGGGALYRSNSSTISYNGSTASAAASAKNITVQINSNFGYTVSEEENSSYAIYITVFPDGSASTSGNGEFSRTYSSVDTTTNDTSSSTSYTFSTGFGSSTENTLEICSTTLTNYNIYARKTKTIQLTYTGPLEGSQATYSDITYDSISNIYNISVKTTYVVSRCFTGDELSETLNIEWIGYDGSGQQNIAIIYTQTGENYDISEYNSVIAEADSYSSSRELTSASWHDGTLSSLDVDTYTLTYDYTSISEDPTITTSLVRDTFATIDSFEYGFISISNTDLTISKVILQSSTDEYTSVARNSDYINTDLIASYYAFSHTTETFVGLKTTTKNFTEFFNVTGLDTATSFNIRKTVNSTIETTQYNFVSDYLYTNNPQNIPVRIYTVSFAPARFYTALVVRENELSPNTFYTEKAYYASFINSYNSYSYKKYSPEKCSLVFLALLPAYETNETRYASYVNIYNGQAELPYDRGNSSLESITLNQVSSCDDFAGATSVYQTISYFSNNNTQSLTTRTDSILMEFADRVNSSVLRMARTNAENLDSAYINSYLPSIPVNGQDVLFTVGLQGEANYNIDNVLINAFTTNISTFADSQYTFPVSKSEFYGYFSRNKIRIDSVNNVNANNTTNINLFRYSNTSIF